MNVRSRPLCVALVGVAVIGLAACGGGSKKATKSASPTPTVPTTSATPTPTPTPTATPTPVLAAVNPFTGVGAPSGNAVVAVKIDDTGNGRPQVGIDKANVVYIEAAEGGLTRLVAIFNTVLPTVEAVRSTRASDPELLAQYGPIDYVASGGGGNTLQVLDASPLKSSINDRGGPGFARDNNRSAPYNLTANLTQIAAVLKGAKSKSIGWTFSAATTQLIGTPTAYSVNTVVGATRVTFDWDAKTGRYNRLIGGVVQHAADGAVVSTPNVIVQFCTVTTYLGDIDVNGNPSQYTHSIGSGKVAVFRNGHEVLGTWKRATASAGTTLLDSKGNQIPLALGGAWVVLANSGAALSS